MLKLMNLNDDILREIGFNLDLQSILYLSSLNIYIYNTLDNIFYKNVAYKLYTRNVWMKVTISPVSIYRTFKNIKLELIKMEFYQNTLNNRIRHIWTNDDIYNYWKYNKSSNNKDKILSYNIFKANIII